MSDDEVHDYGVLQVIEHEAWCGTSMITEVLDARAQRRPYRTARLHAGDPVPELTGDVQGLLVMGGPQGVPRRDQFAFMEDEFALLRSAVEEDVPVLGICLGSQLLAHALGGEVSERDAPEIGMLPLTRTEAGREDEIAAGWPDGGRQLFIHDDEVTTLPEGGVQLLDGSDGIALWRAAGDLSYGVQFHPEVSGDQFATWAAMDSFPPRFDAAGVELEAFVAEVKQHERFARAYGLSLVGRWLDGVVGRDDPTPRRKRKAA